MRRGGLTIVHSSDVARTISSALPRSRLTCVRMNRKKSKNKPFPGNKTAAETRTSRFTPALVICTHRAGGTLLDECVRAERLRWASAQRRKHGIVSREDPCHLMHVAGVAVQHLQVWMAACDLLRRAHERRYLMISSERQIDELCSCLSIGTEDKKSHGADLLSNRPERSALRDRWHSPIQEQHQSQEEVKWPAAFVSTCTACHKMCASAVSFA